MVFILSLLLLCRGANPQSNTGELSLRLAALQSQLQAAEQKEKELDQQKERMHQCLKNFVDRVKDEEYQILLPCCHTACMPLGC